MEAITIESLGTVVGVTLVILAILQGVKVAFPDLTTQWIRRVALLLGILLMVVTTWASGPIGEARTLVMLFLVSAVNGIIAGLAAGAGFDHAKYGNNRLVTDRGDDSV